MALSLDELQNGKVNPCLTSVPVNSSEELHDLIASALSHRRVSPTLRNATSSRSHAILRISVKNTLLPYAEDGQFILVE
jgi:kinesin family member 2/24